MMVSEHYWYPRDPESKDYKVLKLGEIYFSPNCMWLPNYLVLNVRTGELEAQTPSYDNLPQIVNALFVFV